MAGDPNVHLKALQKALAAGDTEAADFIRGELVRSYEDEAEVEGNPAAGQPWHENLRAGVGHGMLNVVKNVGNIAGVVDDQEIADLKARDKPLTDTTAGKVGSFIGETAATAIPAGGVASGVARLGKAGAKVAGNLVGRGAIEGAAQGAILADPGERVEGATTGAVAGAALPAAGAAYRGARSGVRPTKEANRLLKEGVDLSPGQMNPKGVLNQIEQAAEQVPVVGQLVKGVRDRAEQQFQQKSVQKAAPPGTDIPLGKPDQMLDAAYRAFQPLYDQARGFPVNDAVLRNAMGVKMQLPAVAALAKAFVDATGGRAVRATSETRKGVDSFLKEQLTAISNRHLTSDDLLALRSAIRTEGRRARISTDAQEQAAADLLKRAELAVTKGIKASISKSAAQALDVGDQHYRVYKVLEDAVYRAGDRPRGFTPNDLSQSVRKSTGKGEYARGGGGKLREMSSAGREALDPTAPKTGLLGMGTLGTLGSAAWFEPTVGLPATAAVTGLIGTKTGRRIAAGKTRPQLMARELERELRRALPKDVREAGARIGRGSVVSANAE
jgi:hypothetical protein